MALILWDYDGVLVDSAKVEKEYYLPACKEAGIEQISTFEDLVRLCQGNYYEECIKAGIDIKKVETSFAIFRKTLREIDCQYEVFSGMPELMTETARCFPSYIVTSNHSSTVEATLREHRIEGIREILGADKEKSKVRKINYVKGLFPEEKTYFIGDTSGDILEAQAGGADVAIGVVWGWHTEEMLAASRPDHIFSKVSELRDFLNSVT